MRGLDLTISYPRVQCVTVLFRDDLCIDSLYLFLADREKASVMSKSIAWPPRLSPSQLDSLTLLGTTYALSHGLVYLPVSKTPPSVPTSTIHAPLALFPSPIPRNLFTQAQRLQSIYNVLYSRIATNEEFLDTVMGEVGKVDDFTGQLWSKWRRLRNEGIVQVRWRSLSPG